MPTSVHPRPKSRIPRFGIGLSALDRNQSNNPPPPKFQSNRRDEDKSKLVCTHCGGKKHTKDTCFLIHGYLKWWEEMKKSRANRSLNRGGSAGRASVAVGERATYTDNPPAGSIAPPSTTIGEDRTRGGNSEKEAVASVSMARTWSEGTKPASTASGGRSTAAKVSIGEEDGGARVSREMARVSRRRSDKANFMHRSRG